MGRTLRLLYVALAWTLATLCSAHPGNGIVALEDGRIITGDAVGNGIWIFEEGKAPRRLVRDFHCHWLTLGQDGRLYAERQAAISDEWQMSIYRVPLDGSSPIKLANDMPLAASQFTADRHGRLIFWSEGKLVARDSGGKLTPFRTHGGLRTGERALPEPTALSWSGNDLFVSSQTEVRRISPSGEAAQVATFSGTPSVEMYGGRGGARIWGMCADPNGNVFVALSSHAKVVSIDPQGRRSTVGAADNGWIATGVAERNGELFSFETKLVGNRNLGPRVRKRTKNGAFTVVGRVGPDR